MEIQINNIIISQKISILFINSFSIIIMNFRVILKYVFKIRKEQKEKNPNPNPKAH
jgi:hypothetical protein